MQGSPATHDRPMRMRARPDLLASAIRVPHGGRWVISDPVTRAHFELSEEEYALLTWLDENTSFRQLQQQFQRRFAPRQIQTEELWRFLTRLHEDGLAVSTATGQGEQLWRRDQRRQSESRRWAWTQVLAIRLPSIDPDRFLTRLYDCVGWAFRPWALGLAALAVLAGVATAIANASELAADLPGLAILTEPRNLLALIVTALGVKVLHELGHALACKHFGGEVREMGVLLLAFAPCLYCDVSDMWRLPSKTKRMAVTAAGMGVELLLAALAVIVWRVTEPGLLHSMALAVMIVCTVGTLLVNANPLLRYDGYYLLADYSDVSNLWQRSRQAVHDRFASWFPKTEKPSSTGASSWRLAAYGLASQMYVTFIVITILWLMVATLKPLGLAALGWGLAALSLAAVLAGPARRAVQWARNPAARRRTHPRRLTLAAALVALPTAAALWAPWSYTVEAEAITFFDQPQQVVSTLEGRLLFALAAGDRVSKGEVIAQLENPEVTREILVLEGMVVEQKLRIRQAEAMRARWAEANDLLRVEQWGLTSLQQQLAERQQDQQRLTLRADRDGVVIAPPRTDPNFKDPAKLPRWQGSPLDPKNRGAWIEPGALLAIVAQPTEVEVLAAIGESDVERLRVGQAVRVAMRQTPGVVLTGRVTDIANSPTWPERQPEPLGQLTNWSPLQPAMPAPEAHYRVGVSLEGHEESLLLGGAGRVKIDTGATTLGRWITDGFSQTFRLPR